MKKYGAVNRSITSVFYLYCFLLNAVILLICVVSFLLYSRQNIVATLDDVLISNSATVQQQFDTIQNNADNTLKEIQTNKDLMNISKGLGSSGQNHFNNNIIDKKQFLTVFRFAMVSWGTKGSICFYSNTYDNVGFAIDTGEIPSLSFEKIKNETVLPQILQSIKYVDYVPPHADYNDADKTVFSVVRAMRDPYNIYGILVYNYDIDTVARLLDGLESPEDYDLSILDTDGALVYSTAEETMAQQIYKSYKEHDTEDNAVFKTGGEWNSCVQHTVSGWTLILTTDNYQYTQSVRKLILTAVLLFGTIFLIMSAFLKLLIRQLTTPLRKLAEQLAGLKEGENIVVEAFPQSSEVALLSNTIQDNLHKTILQNQRLTEATEKTLQAQYHAMEAQLNPHMLYNTLSVIGMAALNDGSARTAEMCGDLADILRYSVAYTGQNVSMDQEIENIRAYMKIMKARYEEDFVFDIQTDPGLESIIVPKLILQPIVENCFKHGFRQTEPPWRIGVTVTVRDRRWIVAVENNGKEFDEDVIAQLETFCERLRDSTYLFSSDLAYGHGLESTIYRLHIHEHGKEQVQIVSTEGKICVMIGGSLDAKEG